MSDFEQKDERDGDRHWNRRSRRGGGIGWGIILILLGIIFLFQRLVNFTFVNWWALFILLPAISSFVAAYELYRRQGHFSYGVRNSLIGGLIPLVVALLFLFNLNWAIYWPLFIILGGVGLFFNGFTPGRSGDFSGNSLGRLYQPWAIWTGLGAVFLGTGFLTRNMGIYDPTNILPNWWGIAILFPAVGGLITAFLLYQERKTLDWVVMSSLFLALPTAVVGIIALLGLSWNFVGPLILIVVGLAFLFGFRGIERRLQ